MGDARSLNDRAYQDLGNAADLMMPWSASALLDEGQQLSLRGAVDRVLEILADLSGGEHG